MPDEQDEVGAPALPRYSGSSKVAATWHPNDEPVPLCAHHREALLMLAQKDHVGDEDSERVAGEMRRQCCGRIQ